MLKMATIMTTLCILFTFTSAFAGNILPETNTAIDVLIDAGHGGIDGGTVYGNTLEKNITLEVAKILYKQLSMKGYAVALNRTGDYALSEENSWLNNPSRHRKDLAQRKYLAHELSPKIMVSLHVNSSSNPADRGPIVLYQQNNQSFLLADIMQHSLNNLFKTSELPISRKNLYLLNHSICPTVLVEIGFITNPTDRMRLTTPLQQAKIASSISSAIDTYFLLLNQTITNEANRKGSESDE
jgi:N-acetylmuramoyl-L-alanine amidase